VVDHDYQQEETAQQIKCQYAPAFTADCYIALDGLSH
jgi:hypothetical protein